MIPKGQKRKLPPEEEEEEEVAAAWSAPAWESQRQFVFSVSLLKYQHSQELAEPSLRRSVLIANTLRQVSLSQAAAASPETQRPPVAADDGGSNRTSSCGSRAAAADEEDWGSMSTDPDFEVETAIASILCSLDSTADGSLQVAPRAPLRAVENLAEPAEGGASWGQREEQQQQQQGGGVEALRSGYLSDVTVEDLFQDIDTSLLETDVEVLGVRSADELLRYLPPLGPASDAFAVALNPGLRCLPAFSSFIPSSSSSSSSSASLPRDAFELEHLMEVLVES